MLRFTSRLSRRATCILVVAVASVGTAGAATFHRFDVAPGTGSLGATTYVQSSTSGGALQGNTGTAVTGVQIPFGLFGTYNVSSTQFGIGALGASTTGYGVAGESFSDTQPSILAYPGGNGPGLEATTQTTSQSPAIFAVSTNTADAIVGNIAVAPDYNDAAGVFGEDTSSAPSTNVGVLGTTVNGNFGVEGQAPNNSVAGVAGETSTGTGVFGVSETGDGIEGAISNPDAPTASFVGNSGANVGVFGNNTANVAPSASAPPATSAGVYGFSYVGPGVIGVNASTSAASSNGMDAGVYGQSTYGDGLYANSANYVGAYISNNSTYTTLEVQQNTTGGNALVVQNPTETTATLDGNGNLTLTGMVTDSYGTFARTRNPSSDRMSYGAQSAEPTIDDIGSAQLVNGYAAVPLASDFRETIDPSESYMVIVTPEGDTSGLYVSSRTPAGFVVRESHGGHANLAFDYRVVARTYGAREGRLPHEAQLHPNAAREAALNGAPAPAFRSRIPAPLRVKSKHGGSLFMRKPRAYAAPPIPQMPTRAQILGRP